MEAIETFEATGFTVSLYYEEDPDSPRNWDNLGKMVCWHRRYRLGDQTIKTDDFSSMEELVASFNARIIIPLYLYDHSGLTMRTGPFGDPWDSGQVGFIYVTDETLRKEYSVPPGQDIPPEDLELARQVLVGEVETYDQYLTGDVYGYVLRSDGEDIVDSCWGFFGLEYARQEAQAVLASASDGKEVPVEAEVPENTVVITVQGGVIQNIHYPDGVTVEVLDFDTEGADEGDLCKCSMADAPHFHSSYADEGG